MLKIGKLESWNTFQKAENAEKLQSKTSQYIFLDFGTTLNCVSRTQSVECFQQARQKGSINAEADRGAVHNIHNKNSTRKLHFLLFTCSNLSADEDE